MLSAIWTVEAKKEKANILKYWIKRNGSKDYSNKIELQSRKAVKLIKENPLIGKKVKNTHNVRCLIVMNDYSIFYSVKEKHIEILSFWDNRQNPEQLQL